MKSEFQKTKKVKKKKATNHNNSTELSSVISREKRNLIYTNYAQFVQALDTWKFASIVLDSP